MKTKTFLLIILIISSYLANAQFRQYTFGLKAAPQISWIKPNLDTYQGDGARLGFSWGFISEFGISENNCIASGFNIVFNGGNLKFAAKNGNGDAGTMRRAYYIKSVEIPLTLKMRTNPIGNIRYYGQIGFGTSFRFDAKAKDEFTLSNNTTITSPKASYNNVSFLRESLIVGLGAEYTPHAGPTFSAGLDLNNGFTDMLSGSNSLSSKKEKATLSFVELTIAVLF